MMLIVFNKIKSKVFHPYEDHLSLEKTFEYKWGGIKR